MLPIVALIKIIIVIHNRFMKEKLLAALKLKYKTLGLSDKVLSGIADMLAVTTTEEANIETAVDGVEDLLKTFQSDADARVTEAVKKVKPKEDKPKEEAPKVETPKPSEEVPAYMKTLLDGFKVMESKLTALEQGKTLDTRKQLLEQKLKDANPTFKATVLGDFERMQFADDDDFNTFVESKVTAAGELTKSANDEQLGSLTKPALGAGQVLKGQPAKEELDAVMGQIM